MHDTYEIRNRQLIKPEAENTRRIRFSGVVILKLQ